MADQAQPCHQQLCPVMLVADLMALICQGHFLLVLHDLRACQCADGLDCQRYLWGQPLHYEKYCQSTTKVQAQVLQNLRVP